MILIKLTDCNGRTRHGLPGKTRWAVGDAVAPTGVGDGGPCGPGALHFYQSVSEAVLYNPIHGGYGAGVRAFECDGELAGDDGLKVWATTPVRVLREVSLPAVTLEQRVAWAICLAPHPATRKWAIG